MCRGRDKLVGCVKNITLNAHSSLEIWSLRERRAFLSKRGVHEDTGCRMIMGSWERLEVLGKSGLGSGLGRAQARWN